MNAVLSEDRKYRYLLTRDWPLIGDAGKAVFVMLNPSTADETCDDPTIRRCITFAKSWGCSGLVVANLYAYRATHPSQLWNLADDPIGPENDRVLLDLAIEHKSVVCAWGASARQGRVKEFCQLMSKARAELLHLGLTKSGQPRHPLYLRKDVNLQLWPEQP